MEIKFTKAETLKAKPADETKLGFGHIFTDYMLVMPYDEGQGWHDPEIRPYGPIELSPAAMCLHYGQTVFQGLKAYRTAEGKIQLFRPDENFKRLNVSNQRLVIPHLDEELAMNCLMELLKVEKDWVPSAPATSLYLRPFMFGCDEHLGVHTVHHSVFMIIASPVGSYYKAGINPVKIMIEDEDVRAVKGGTGYTKCGGNYAASTRAGERAAQKGYSQVLWLDGVERKYIEEVGSMNMFFKFKDALVTPPLLGSILGGITRDSIIKLARHMGIPVEERRLTVQDVFDAAEKGELEEAFGSGTAAVVSPVGRLAWNDKEIIISGGKIGACTQKFYDTLTGIQFGTVEDPFGWVLRID